jgi:prepilin-type N-terminal cleavage/methylation domain-containing protein
VLRILKNDRGFTLIELVIIIILVGVLAAIAIPRYVDMRNNAVVAKAKVTLDAGKAAVMMDFADQVMTTGGYVSRFSGTGIISAGNLPEIEDLLEPNPNYPPDGPYGDPGNEYFRWYVISRGSLSTATSPVPPEMNAVIDLVCASSDTLPAPGTANDDCDVSKL